MKISHITDWIRKYALDNQRSSLVVGISGGIDSSVVSVLCARTNMEVYSVSMPINQIPSQHNLSIMHGEWLASKYPNVKHQVIDLTNIYNTFNNVMAKEFDSEHSFANSKSRIRMIALHQISGSKNGIVVGTGNKVEDFGVGFFTKYGDGGVDISPIADLLKTEVWNLGRELGILQEIIDAPPTDGLWEDGRTDHDQLKGLTYQELEEAMMDNRSKHFKKYNQIRKPNLHKMKPIPIFKKDDHNAD